MACRLVGLAHQAIILTNAGTLLIGTLGTNFSDILMAAILSRPQCIDMKWAPSSN